MSAPASVPTSTPPEPSLSSNASTTHSLSHSESGDFELAAEVEALKLTGTGTENEDVEALNVVRETETTPDVHPELPVEQKSAAQLAEEERLRPILAAFRGAIAGDIEAALKENPECELANAVKFSDRSCVQWLTARKFDVPKAVQMWRDALKWRKENKIDTVLNDPFPDGTIVKNILNCHCDHGFDKFGRPVYIEVIGNLDPKAALKQVDMDRMMRYTFHSTEFRRKFLMKMGSVQSGRIVDQVCSIIDLKGFGTKHMKKVAYNFIKTLSKISADNYPEFLGKMFVINAPTLFSVVWKMLAPFIDERTKTKIEIHRDGAKNALLAVIDENTLPAFLGGKCVCQGPGGCLANSFSQRSYTLLTQVGMANWAAASPDYYAKIIALTKVYKPEELYPMIMALKNAQTQTNPTTAPTPGVAPTATAPTPAK